MIIRDASEVQAEFAEQLRAIREQACASDMFVWITSATETVQPLNTVRPLRYSAGKPSRGFSTTAKRLETP